jgi:tetratricopeptide (TPR) repeat protein
MRPEDASRFEAEIGAALAATDLPRAEAIAEGYLSAARAEALAGDPSRSPWFRANYLAAQVALAGSRLAKVVRLLEPFLARTADLAPDLACEVWLMSAEALARLEVREQARAHLARARRAGPALERSPLLRLRAIRIRLWLGEVDGLSVELESCGRALGRAGALAGLALLACEEGRAWEARGDLGRAEACWHRAANVAHGPDSASIRADVLLQLGRLEHLRGHLQAALDRYRDALACLDASNPQWLEIRLRNLLVRLEIDPRWGRAREEFARLLRGTTSDRLPEEIRGLAAMLDGMLNGKLSKHLDAETEAYVRASRGEEGRARELYGRALEAASVLPERRARHALALGVLALNASDPAEAERWLDQGLQLADRCGLLGVRGQACQALGRVASELRGDDDRARPFFEEAVTIAEVQAGQLDDPRDRAASRGRQGGVLRHLLRGACRRADAARVFRYQELGRGRLLFELWHAAARRPGRMSPAGLAELDELDRQIEVIDRGPSSNDAVSGPDLLRRRGELVLRRDRRLDDLLADPRRMGSAALPALPTLADLERALPIGTVYVAASLLDDEVALLVARPGGGSRVVRAEGCIRGAIEDFRHCVEELIRRYDPGGPPSPAGRAELDRHLDGLGRGPLGTALRAALQAGPGTAERIVWVPEGILHGLPIHALRMDGRYLVEDHEVVSTFSGALFVHQERTAVKRWRRRLALVVAGAPGGTLRYAELEGRGVATAFSRHRLLIAEGADKSEIRRLLSRARIAHFACHAEFNGRHPLDAAIELPSGERWRAAEWLDEPVDGLPMVALSACRSAAVADLDGRGIFGLVAGVLGGGARAVLAGLWPVADREAVPLVWRFYRHGMAHDPAAALARAQRDMLAESGSSPLFWAAFTLYGDGSALPPPRPRWGWWVRLRQRRHERRCIALGVPCDPHAAPHEGDQG